MQLFTETDQQLDDDYVFLSKYEKQNFFLLKFFLFIVIVLETNFTFVFKSYPQLDHYFVFLSLCYR